MPEEVRYMYLRPAQIVERRKACSIAYIPLGTIEWHGLHDPMGTDSIQAEHLAVMCARMGGGLVMPTLHWGDNRLAALMDANPWAREDIAAAMAYDAEGATVDRWLREEPDQNRLYHELLLHMLNQVENYGFKVAIFIAGHYPLVDRATMAVLEYNKIRRKVGKMLAWATLDYLHLAGKYDCAGDHAGGWETSHLLATHPECVDLSVLPPKGEKLVGAFGLMEPQDATAEFGELIYREAAEDIVKEAHNRLSNPDAYKDHGISIRLGIPPVSADHIGNKSK